MDVHKSNVLRDLTMDHVRRKQSREMLTDHIHADQTVLVKTFVLTHFIRMSFNSVTVVIIGHMDIWKLFPMCNRRIQATHYVHGHVLWNCFQVNATAHLSDKSTMEQWLRWWLCAVRQQGIVWASMDQDLCQHLASNIKPQLFKMPSKIFYMVDSKFRLCAYLYIFQATYMY